jgi:hypothetical protein
MKSHLVLSLLVALCLFGCSTPVQQVRPGIQPIVLKAAETKHLAQGGTVSVPAGVYMPDFETEEGVYYRAQGHLIHKIIGITQIFRGGIFIPNPATEKELEQAKVYEAELNKINGGGQGQRLSLKPPRDFKDEGVWFDQQEQSGGLLIAAVTSPKRIFRVTEPFNYEIQKQQP